MGPNVQLFYILTLCGVSELLSPLAHDDLLNLLSGFSLGTSRRSSIDEHHVADPCRAPHRIKFRAVHLCIAVQRVATLPSHMRARSRRIRSLLLMGRHRTTPRLDETFSDKNVFGGRSRQIVARPP